ncbi:MAG: DoxX family membrane protein [Opitutaceae bacterium]|nr:DoxX family membrane protein [Opitutaceae bacterium]
MNNKCFLIARLLLAVLLLVFGLNKFLGYMPMPEMQGSAADVMAGFGQTGYIFQAVGIVEILVGFLLLINRFSALALILLAPVVVNMLLFHIFHDISGIGLAALVGALNLVLLIAHKPAYSGVLACKAERCCCSGCKSEESE